MRHEKPEQSTLLWEKGSGISGKCSAAVCARILYFKLAPGDPLVSYYGDRVEKMTPEERAWAEEKLGLNDPISVQYIRWAGNALHGDFGISYKYKMDVTRVIEGRIGNTLVLGGIGFLLIFTLALLLGILCAWKEDTWLDRIICKVGTITGCIPEFWLSLLLILVFPCSSNGCRVPVPTLLENRQIFLTVSVI